MRARDLLPLTDDTGAKPRRIPRRSSRTVLLGMTWSWPLATGRSRSAANEQAFTGAFSWSRRRPVGIPGKRSTRQVMAEGDPRSHAGRDSEMTSAAAIVGAVMPRL